MKNSTSNSHLSRGVEKNGQEIGLENELKMLTCIFAEGWIREHELHLLTGMSLYTVGQVSRRLAKKDEIYRQRAAGNAGYFLRLLEGGAKRINGKSGKDINIPASWAHHAMAIQTLHYLANHLECTFVTEASIRHQKKQGKQPDGYLYSKDCNYHFEQERSRKSGPLLRKQSEEISKLAAKGTICIVAYPFPAKLCGGVDHETRLRNSLKQFCNRKSLENIQFIRCHFESLLSFEHAHISDFEIIHAPFLRNDNPTTNSFIWEMTAQHKESEKRRIHAVLIHEGDIEFECIFIEASTYDDDHIMSVDGSIEATATADLQSLDDFIIYNQRKVEREIQGQINLAKLNRADQIKNSY